jgi:glycosyltransferase involved in cell wall biosynthesis
MTGLVSCYCPTFGRVHCLEEAVESFLRQDYKGPKELVILNDRHDQNLIFDHPEVKIFNMPYRITPIGSKFNTVVSLCEGDTLFCWDDDDIYLPHRISYSLERMKDGVYHTTDAFFEKGVKNIEPSSNMFHSTHAISAKLFNSIGGYREYDKCSVDADLKTDLTRKLGREYSTPTPINERFYIYRWSTVGTYHLSGWGGNHGDVSLSTEAVVEGEKARGKVPAGDIVLQPKWSYEYTEYLPK